MSNHMMIPLFINFIRSTTSKLQCCKYTSKDMTPFDPYDEVGAFQLIPKSNQCFLLQGFTLIMMQQFPLNAYLTWEATEVTHVSKQDFSWHFLISCNKAYGNTNMENSCSYNLMLELIFYTIIMSLFNMLSLSGREIPHCIALCFVVIDMA